MTHRTLWLPRAAFATLVACGALTAAAHAGTHYESGVLTNTQQTGASWRSVTFDSPFAVPPVIVLGPSTYNDTQALTFRVRNVTTTGFQYQLDEWDYLDDAHASEVFSYLALEPGTHSIGGLTWQVGRISGVTRTAQTASFATPFSVAPVVLTQVESANNSKAVISRARLVTTGGFEVRLQTQESDTAALSGESIGYIAVLPGAGTLDGSPISVGRTGAAITQAWASLSFGGSFRKPLFFAQSQTQNGADPYTIRQRNLSDTGVEIFLQEEQSGDAEVSHVAEDVGYIVLSETQGELRAKLEFGSVQVSQPNTTTWTSVVFDEPYTNPVVVFGPVQQGDSEPATIRVRNVTSNGFEFQVDEWDYQDGVHPSTTVSYLVAEEGSYQIGGKLWQFGRASSVNHLAAVRSFAEAFPTAPVVLAQTVTANGPSAVADRISNVTTTGFTMQLQEEEAADGTHSAESVHFVAIEKGSGRLAARETIFEAGATGSTITNAFSTVSITRKLASPILLADSQTKNDPETIAPRYRNLNISNFDVRVQEETSAAPETVHGAENVGYLALAQEIDRDEDGIADSWETANGLNPADPNDATLDPDGDGVTNVNEYRFATNPNVFDSAGNITAQVINAEATEKEGTTAKLQINRTGGTVPTTVYFTLSGRATPPGATGADYRTKNGSGGTLSGSVNLGFGVNSATVVIEPIADTLDEYPEDATLTLTPNSRYSIGAASSGSVLLEDAAATPENEQLFVAFLAPGNSVQSYASGLATVYLNGPKNAARVNLSFSGLTANQTNAYIRYGVPSGVGPELRPTLPIGQVTGEPWNIVPAGVYSGQDIIDALFQVGGHYVYLNVGTGNYPAGEITGKLSRQTGSTTFNPPPAPPAITPLTGDALTRDVVRFLTQATFGPTLAEIDALVTDINTTYGGDRLAAYRAWINAQFALDQTRLLDLTEATDADEWNRRGSSPDNFTTNDEPRHNNRRRSWWLLATNAHDQLRQRIAFALSELFVVSDAETVVRQKHYGTANYYDLLASRADGNFRDLLEDVSKSPIMGKYLSHLQNQKAIVDAQTGQVIVSPDENYAREIMQLFSIGLVHRHLDGTLKLGADGLPIQTYTNADITELARVFTGWSFSKKNGAKADGYPVLDNTNFNQGNGPAYYQASWLYPLKNFAAYHDTGAKTVLGSSIPSGLAGQQDLDAALDIIFNHPNVAPFISRQLIQRLVTSNPSAGYIYRVAQKFENDGNGVRGNLKAVVRAILTDYEARSLDVVSNVGYGKQKEPIIRYVQLLRALGGKSDITVAALSSYGYPAGQLDNFPSGATLYRYPDTDSRLSQTPQSAPTVFNWFHPDHNPGGAIASAGLVAPELEITTETTAVQAINYHYNLTNIDNGQDTTALINSADPLEDNVQIDRTALVQLYDQEITAGKTVAEATATVLDHLDVLLTSGNLKVQYATAAAPNPRSIILNTVSSLPGTATSTQRVKELLYLLVSSPEYIHQK